MSPIYHTMVAGYSDEKEALVDGELGPIDHERLVDTALTDRIDPDLVIIGIEASQLSEQHLEPLWIEIALKDGVLRTVAIILKQAGQKISPFIGADIIRDDKEHGLDLLPQGHLMVKES
jgi:hypothetical protein